MRLSWGRLAELRQGEGKATGAAAEGNLYPLLTLLLGRGVHQAMIDVSEDFERTFLPDQEP